MLTMNLLPELAREVTWLSFRRPAMATTFEVCLPFGTPNAHEAAEEALNLIDAIEAQLTVYRDSSEVSHLNRRAADVALPVEPELFELLQLCGELTRQSQGAFDVAIGALIRAWGFLTRQGRVPPAEELQAAREASGFRHVLLNPEQRSVKFLRRGLELNFGSIGKGYALDRAAELLQTRYGIRSALLQGGGSSVRAIGHPPGWPQGWGVAIRHPANDGTCLKTAWLCDQGLGTSAATFQRFRYNNRELGHVLDPRSGWPAEGIASATAVAPSAALADAWSTAWLILGVDVGSEYCRTRPELAALLLTEEPNAALHCLGTATHWTD